MKKNKIKGFYLQEGVLENFSKKDVDDFIESSLDMEKNIKFFDNDFVLCSNVVNGFMFITWEKFENEA